jgi:very-short-patch-repair endonuclease
MANLYGGSGKALWDDMKSSLERQPRSERVSGMKGLKVLIDKEILREIATMLPLIGTKTAVLADIWEQLGGQSADCPSSHDTIADSGRLEELANVFQVQSDKILTLHRKHAVTPEEKAVLTINGNHKQLFALVDIAMMVTGKDQNHAAEQVRRIFEAFPQLRKQCVKTSFGEGPTQWAGDLETATQLAVRLPSVDVGRAIEICRMLAEAFGVPVIAITNASQAKQQRHSQERDEHIVRRWLRASATTAWRYQVDIAGYRIDFVLDASWGKILLEVDENQHKAYSVPAEVQRTRMLSQWAEEQLTVALLVRFNLGAFMVDGHSTEASQPSRKSTLLSLLRIVQNAQWCMKDRLQIVYLYYDMDSNCHPCILTDIHYPEDMKLMTLVFDLKHQNFTHRNITDLESTRTDLERTRMRLEDLHARLLRVG